jgi:hypothetical protein
MDELVSTPPSDAAPTPQLAHTLTVPEVVSRFADAGVPRAARTIQTYCKTGTLNCITVPGELGPKYLVNEQSVEDRIQEFVQMRDLLAASFGGANGARHSALQHASTRTSAQERASADVALETAETPPIKSEEAEKLREELAMMRGELKARDAFIGMLQKDKQDQFNMFWNYTTKISDQSRELGRLEERLSIDAPQESYPHMPTEENDV